MNNRPTYLLTLITQDFGSKEFEAFPKTLDNNELNKIFDKFYSSTCNENTWNWLWLPIIKEIIKVLWYELKVDSYEEKFKVEIFY